METMENIERSSSRVYKEFFPSNAEHDYPPHTQESYEDVTSDSESDDGYIETAQETTADHELTAIYREECINTSSSRCFVYFQRFGFIQFIPAVLVASPCNVMSSGRKIPTTIPTLPG